MKITFNGPVGSVSKKHIGDNKITMPLSGNNPTVESEAENEYLQKVTEDLAKKIAQGSRENTQELLKKLEELKPQLVRKKSESSSAWYDRIKEQLEVFANAAGIAGFALSVFTQLK